MVALASLLLLIVLVHVQQFGLRTGTKKCILLFISVIKTAFRMENQYLYYASCSKHLRRTHRAPGMAWAAEQYGCSPYGTCDLEIQLSQRGCSDSIDWPGSPVVLARFAL